MATVWNNELQALKSFPEFCDASSLYKMYEEKNPTSKRVIKLLHAEPSSDTERMCLDHLKRFIKSLNESKLAGFLQFVTGSNIVTVNQIEVAFKLLLDIHVPSSLILVLLFWKYLQPFRRTMSYPNSSATLILLISSAWSFDIV